MSQWRAILRPLGYLWSAPFGVIGLLAAVLFWALRWVHTGAWRDGALELVCRGPFARWMARPRYVGTDIAGNEIWARWEGFTLAWTILFWVPPVPGLIRHEHRHVDQSLILGIFMPIVWGVQVAIYGYHDSPLERDARRAADGRPGTTVLPQ